VNATKGSLDDPYRRLAAAALPGYGTGVTVKFTADSTIQGPGVLLAFEVTPSNGATTTTSSSSSGGATTTTSGDTTSSSSSGGTTTSSGGTTTTSSGGTTSGSGGDATGTTTSSSSGGTSSGGTADAAGTVTDTFDWSTYWQSSSQTSLPKLDLGIVPEQNVDATVPMWADGSQPWTPSADGEVDLWSVTESNNTGNFDSADAWGLSEDFYSMSDGEWAAQYASMTFNFSDTDGSYMDWNASMYSEGMYDAYFSSDTGLWDESYTSDAFAYTCCEAPLKECTNTTELKDTFVAFDPSTGVGCSMTSEYFLKVLVRLQDGDNIPRVANGVGYYSKLPALSTDLPSATGSTATSVSTAATGGSAAGAAAGQAGSADGALSQAVSEAVSTGTAPLTTTASSTATTTAATGTTATATSTAPAAASQQSVAPASANATAVLAGVPEATAAPTTHVSTYTVTTGISLAGE
jgi:hypothetical protein